MQCFECGRDFDPDDDERDVCFLCEARATRNESPELIADEDWCRECDAPIGLGTCDGCAAVACVDAMYDGPGPECCENCGKEFEDFSDLGCDLCDQRSPDFGLVP